MYETLQLVLLRLGLSRGVEEIDSERLMSSEMSIVSVIERDVMETDHDVFFVSEEPFCLSSSTTWRCFLCAKSGRWRNDKRPQFLVCLCR